MTEGTQQYKQGLDVFDCKGNCRMPLSLAELVCGSDNPKAVHAESTLTYAVFAAHSWRDDSHAAQNNATTVCNIMKRRHIFSAAQRHMLLQRSAPTH